MFRKSYLILLLTVSGGLLWTSVSDHLLAISYPGHGHFYNPVRLLNDLIWITLTVFIVFRQIRQQQRVLELSEHQYRGLFECHPNPMWIYHRETLSFIAVNEAALRQYGYTEEEWMQMTIRDIRPLLDVPRLEKMIEFNHNGLNDLGTWRHVRKNGEIFPVSIVSYAVDFQGLPGKLVMATDVTELVQSKVELEQAYLKEKELREESRQREEVIDKISNLVIIVGEDGLIQWVNKAYSQFTGYSLADVVGKLPATIMTGPMTSPATSARLVDFVGRRQFFSDEMINYKKNGDWYWSQLNISPIYDEYGGFSFFISVETVITEKKQREEKILAQHALLQEIAWSNSHELRKPVCSVLGLISLLRYTSTAEDMDECLVMLEKAGEELDQIIRDNNEKISRLEVT